MLNLLKHTVVKTTETVAVSLILTGMALGLFVSQAERMINKIFKMRKSVTHSASNSFTSDRQDEGDLEVPQPRISCKDEMRHHTISFKEVDELSTRRPSSDSVTPLCGAPIRAEEQSDDSTS